MTQDNNLELKKISMNFLIMCYFGQSSDLIRAAIDRAYIDMMAHHRVFKRKETKKKWKCRYEGYKCIRDYLTKYPHNFDSFDMWHEELVREIKDIYEKNGTYLSEGMAQKWLNMTIKYLFVFKICLGEDDPRLSDIASFMDKTSVNDYYPPIDSYVLSSIGHKDKKWSSLSKEEYEEIRKQMKDKENDFVWELSLWERFSEEYKSVDRNSYAKYYNGKEKEK